MDNNYKLIAFSIIFLLEISLVLALGVNSPYWNENPLKMAPGETRDVAFNLENGINEQTAHAFVSLTQGDNIAQITSQTQFTIPPGNKDSRIILKISIPSGVPQGTSYTVEFSVKDSPEQQTGNVQLNKEYKVSFPVQIVGQSEVSPALQTTAQTNSGNKTYLFIIGIVLVLALALIIVISIIKRNSSK